MYTISSRDVGHVAQAEKKEQASEIHVQHQTSRVSMECITEFDYNWLYLLTRWSSFVLAPLSSSHTPRETVVL